MPGDSTPNSANAFVETRGETVLGTLSASQNTNTYEASGIFYLGEQVDEKGAPLRLLLPALHLLLLAIVQFLPVHLAMHGSVEIAEIDTMTP